MAPASEPAVHPLHVVVGDAKSRAVVDQQVSAERPPQNEADRDSAGAAQKGREKRRTEPKRMIKNEIAGQRQEPLVGYGKPNDPQNQ